MGIIAEAFLCQGMENISFMSSENFKKQDNQNYCNALISLGLRLCEPLNVFRLVRNETENELEQLNLAIKAIKSADAVFPCSVKEFTTFFMAADFSDEKMKKCCSFPLIVPKNRQTTITQQEVVVNYSEAVQSKVAYALENVEAHLKNSCVSNIQEAFSLVKPMIGNDVETQVGLVLLADNFMPVTSIQEIWSQDLVMEQPLIECAGTIVVAKLVVSHPMLLQQLQEISSLQKLNQENVYMLKSILENVCTDFALTSLVSEVVCHSNFDLVKKSIKAAENLVMRKLRDISVESIICSFEGGQISKFTSDIIQMPLITVARRISSPAVLENAILMNYAQENNVPTEIGFKVLYEILLKLPYQVENIESYLFEEDFEEKKIKKEKLLLTEICAEYRKIDITEVVSLSQQIFSKFESELKHAVKDFIQNAPTISGKQVSPCEFPDRYNILDNIQGQVCLLGLAERLTNGIIVRQILINEMIENKKISRLPGFFALKKVLEVYPLQVGVLDIYLAEQFLDEAKTNKIYAIYQLISSCSKIFQEGASSDYILNVI